jgi:hypothetical protein
MALEHKRIASSLSPARPSSTPSSSSNIVSPNRRFSLLAYLDINTKGPGNGGSVDERLDHILAIVLEKKRIYEELHKEIVHLKGTVSSLEKENIVVKRELRAVKEATNRTELSSRFLTVRVLGLPVSAEERAAVSHEDRNKAALKTAYDKILKPILNVAKAKGLLEAVPQPKTIIEEGFRINSTSKDKKGVPYPAPLIIRFTKKSYRTAVFLCKREALAQGGRSEGPNCFIVEDLTTPTLKKMKELREDERVAKVWTTEGQIRFTLVDDSKVHKCHGVFSPISEIIKCI